MFLKSSNDFCFISLYTVEWFSTNKNYFISIPFQEKTKEILKKKPPLHYEYEGIKYISKITGEEKQTHLKLYMYLEIHMVALRKLRYMKRVLWVVKEIP